ncbi:serine/threonine-protein kinase TAO2-like [Menidia menidia]
MEGGKSGKENEAVAGGLLEPGDELDGAVGEFRDDVDTEGDEEVRAEKGTFEVDEDGDPNGNDVDDDDEVREVEGVQWEYEEDDSKASHIDSEEEEEEDRDGIGSERSMSCQSFTSLTPQRSWSPFQCRLPPPPPPAQTSLPSLFSHAICLLLSLSAAAQPSNLTLLLLSVFLLSLRRSPPLPSVASLVLSAELAFLALFFSYLLLRSCCSLSLTTFLSLSLWAAGLFSLGLSLSLGIYYIPMILISASFLSSPSLFLSLYLLIVLVVRPARDFLQHAPRRVNRLCMRVLFRLPRPLFAMCQSVMGGMAERNLYEMFPKAGRNWGVRQSKIPVSLKSLPLERRPRGPASSAPARALLWVRRFSGRPLGVLADLANAIVIKLAGRLLRKLPLNIMLRLQTLGLLKRDIPSRLPRLLPREVRERRQRERSRRERERQRKERERMFREEARWECGLRRTSSGRFVRGKVRPWR